MAPCGRSSRKKPPLPLFMKRPDYLSAAPGNTILPANMPQPSTTMRTRSAHSIRICDHRRLSPLGLPEAAPTVISKQTLYRLLLISQASTGAWLSLTILIIYPDDSLDCRITNELEPAFYLCAIARHPSICTKAYVTVCNSGLDHRRVGQGPPCNEKSMNHAESSIGESRSWGARFMA